MLQKINWNVKNIKSMKIAILGWGSLIWKSDNLAFNIESKWSDKGPIIPIEFSRISNDGRLTVVITENGTPVETFFAISTFESLDQAILNLAIREGSNISAIGFYEKSKNQFLPNNFIYKDNIEEWIEKNNSFDAVIWTNLPENWNNKTKFHNRVDYLLSLDKTASEKAEEYILKTPKQIKTKLRDEIEDKLNWK